MNCMKSLALMKKYAACPVCGNDKLGKGEGKLEVTDDVFTRECKCGFKVTTDEDGNQILSRLKLLYIETSNGEKGFSLFTHIEYGSLCYLFDAETVSVGLVG